MTRLLVRVLHRGADVGEEAEPRVESRARAVAPLGDGEAVHVFHHEVRPAVVEDAAVEEARDVRVHEAGEDLALGEEALVQRVVGAPWRRSA
jgi:hypothetical protein